MIGEFEVPGIQRIGTLEARHLVEVPVPGLEGSYHQDLGSAAVAIVIEGTLAGDDARDGFLQSVRDSFNAGEPLDFVADIVTATSVEKVFAADLDAAEVAGSSDTFRYRMVLTQYVEPPPTGPGTDLARGAVTAPREPPAVAPRRPPAPPPPPSVTPRPPGCPASRSTLPAP